MPLSCLGGSAPASPEPETSASPSPTASEAAPVERWEPEKPSKAYQGPDRKNWDRQLPAASELVVDSKPVPPTPPAPRSAEATKASKAAKTRDPSPAPQPTKPRLASVVVDVSSHRSPSRAAASPRLPDPPPRSSRPSKPSRDSPRARGARQVTHRLTARQFKNIYSSWYCTPAELQTAWQYYCQRQNQFASLTTRPCQINTRASVRLIARSLAVGPGDYQAIVTRFAAKLYWEKRDASLPPFHTLVEA